MADIEGGIMDNLFLVSLEANFLPEKGGRHGINSNAKRLLIEVFKSGYRIVCVPDGATNDGWTATVSLLTKSRSLFCLAFRPFLHPASHHLSYSLMYPLSM